MLNKNATSCLTWCHWHFLLLWYNAYSWIKILFNLFTRWTKPSFLSATPDKDILTDYRCLFWRLRKLCLGICSGGDKQLTCSNLKSVPVQSGISFFPGRFTCKKTIVHQIMVKIKPFHRYFFKLWIPRRKTALLNFINFHYLWVE